MLLSTMRPRLVTDESASLRSFRVNASQPPSSLKASSLKLPRTASRHLEEPTIQDLIIDQDTIVLDMGLPPTYISFPLCFTIIPNPPF